MEQRGKYGCFIGVKRKVISITTITPMSTAHDYALLKAKVSILEGEIQSLKNNELDLIHLNADKVKLISIISHDLKNPMNTIIGLTELLEKKIQKNDLVSIEEYAKNINQSTQKIRALLSNLLDWSITVSGKIEFQPIKISLRKIIDEVNELLEETLKLKSLSIVYDCNADVEVFVDKEMISTVLRNIIANSIKFSHPGSEIKISCDRLGDNITVSVSDNGVGMSDKTINTLFKGGNLISSNGTKNETGTGIGLLLCKDFLHKHHSVIMVESEEGKGSTFKFNLPVAQYVYAYVGEVI
jgi:signal transduction histidine kinase